MSVVTLNKKALLDAMPTLKDDIGFQTALLLKVCDQLPTNYLNVVLTKLFYTRVWDKPYYVMKKGNELETYFQTEQDVVKWFMDGDNYPKVISEMLVKRFINGTSKIEDYTIEKKGESL